ncbi:MAG: Maf family protein [Mariprofundaceae bacterium]|nr:Maf family protein [Mariprofundaceae bacterium]
MFVILASQSPRRLQLLQAAGFTVDVRPSHIDESPQQGENAASMTLRLCREKALACVLTDADVCPVIAADTLVCLGDEALGQPKDLEDAQAMLEKLSGRAHQVHTAVCVRLAHVCRVEMVTTLVHFRPISAAEIDTYLLHNDILDKAGSYAIQGGASGFITAIEGALDNVIGLPVLHTRQLIQQVQTQLRQDKEKV